MPEKKSLAEDLPTAGLQSHTDAGTRHRKKSPAKAPGAVFAGPDNLYRAAEMVAEDNKGRVMQYRHDEQNQVVGVRSSLGALMSRR